MTEAETELADGMLEMELARLRLTVAKVREVYDALRQTEVDGKLCRAIANAIEDALIDADYEAVAGETEEAPDLYDALVAAQEELHLLRTKDTGAVYNPMLRTQITLAIAKAQRSIIANPGNRLRANRR